MDQQPKSKPPSAKLLCVLWLTLIALSAGWHFLRYGPFAPQAPVFRRTEQGWKAVARLDYTGYGLRVSPSGVAWVRTRKGLSRLDGAVLRTFTAFDFGTEYGYLPGGFALDGEEVWAASSDGVLHFDAKRWRRYPESLATGEVTSIAAVHGQVWAIDTAGNLSHFDGRAWTIRKLDLPGVRWGSQKEREPRLAATANGVLWLVFQGLWRYDGTSWTRVPGVTGEAGLLGTGQPGSYVKNGEKVETRGGVWLLDDSKVVAINVDGVPKVRYSMRDLGLLDSVTLYQAAGRGRVFVVASSQGLVWFDATGWHGEQLKALGVVTASSVDVAPDGTIWGAAYPQYPAGAWRLHRYLAFGVLLMFAMAVPYTIWWSIRKARCQRQAARDAVLHATGELPEHLQGDGLTARKVAGGVAALLALGGGYWLIKRRWPDAPAWLLPAGLLPALWLGAHIVGTVMESLQKRKQQPWDPIVPGGPPRYDWAKSIAPLLGGLALVVLLYGGAIARHFHVRWLAAVPGLALVLGGQFLFHAFDMFRSHRVEREIKRCRYGKAIEVLDGPLGWPSTGLWKLMRASALFYSGRACEAEPILREMVESQRANANKSLAFEKLGRVLLAQSRYSDARRAFEAAARLSPTRSAAPCGLAEVRLLEGADPAQALADAERALELYGHSLVERKSARERLATIRGNQAWALGCLGRGADAQQAIEAGVRDADLKYTPEAAGLYWRAGMAMLALGNSTAATGHFRRAVELDAQGYYGGLAAQHLRQHSVWGA
jgi:tetratricopeptide (TPR) repeat protein